MVLISQKNMFFIVSAVKISNLIGFYLFWIRPNN
jgi:hypothetical protein